MSRARLVSSAALSIALVFVATSSISIDIPATRGYFNLGDSMVFLTALLFGPVIGGIAGGVGSMLSDIFPGYVFYAPATLIVKGLEGLIAGFLYTVFSNNGSGRTRLSTMLIFIPVMILGSVAVVLMFAGEAELYVFTLGSTTVPLQPLFLTMLVMLTALLMIILRLHKRYIPITIPCFIGGLEMVTGYFVYELSTIGFIGAFSEVPANFAQVFLGTLIAISLYASLEKRLKTGS
ncbi:MAG: ECF transporter S component [Thermoproteota archaeon]